MNTTLRVGIGALVIISILVLIVVLKPNTIKNYPSSGSGVIAFGDSLVEGVGSPETSGFIGILSTRIGIPIVNKGRAGDTTAMALERLPAILEEYPNSKIVILLLGGNDYLKRIPEEETFANLTTIIREFQNRGAVVLLLGVRGGAIRDRFDDNFKTLSKSEETAFVSNVLDGLITKREWMFDAVHPNKDGYEYIADRVEPVLRDIVK